MLCPNCGKELSDTSKFCDNCGTPIQQNAPAQALAAPPPVAPPPYAPPPGYAPPQQRYNNMVVPALKKKRFPVWLIVIICIPVVFFVLIISLLFGGSSSTDAAPSSSSSENTSVSEKEEKTTPKPTEEPEKVNIEETVLFDKDGIRLIAVSLEDDYPAGQKLKVRLENDTDRNITFSADRFDVNGYTLFDFVHVDAAAGKKSNDYITFSDIDLAGIDEIAYIKCDDSYIYDSDSYDDLYSVPFEIRTSLADTYTPAYDPQGVEVINTDQFEAYVSKHYDSIFGSYIDVFIINKTGEKVIVSSPDLSVNGYTIDDWMYETVYAESAVFGDILLSNEDMETNDIETIEDVAFTLEFTDASTYDVIYKSDELSVSFPE